MNRWKRATIILAIFLVIGITWDCYSYWKIGNDFVSPEGICSRITATPTWMDGEGKIVLIGVQMFNSSISKEVTDYFINNSIHLLYSSDCGACIKQIEIFGSEWERYKESGLAVNCNEIKNE